MQLIENKIDIDILYKALSLLKFGADDDVKIKLFLSPYFNRIFNLLTEDVKARFPESMSENRDFWDISNRKELKIVIGYLESMERWNEFTRKEKKGFIISIVSPFTISDEFCNNLIKQLDEYHGAV